MSLTAISVPSLPRQSIPSRCLQRLAASIMRSVACIAVCTLPVVVGAQMQSLFGLLTSAYRIRNQLANAKKTVHGIFAATPCIGENCCAESRCWSSAPQSMFGCKASRGETACVGSKMWPVPHSGTCSCVQGACGTSGACLSTQQALYEVNHEVPIQPEDFTASFLMVGGISASLLLLLVSLVLRKWRSSSHQFQRQLLPVDGSDANFE